MNFKYVIFESNDGYKFPLLVPENAGIKHSDLEMRQCKPVTAGFCHLSHTKDGESVVFCYGESISLNLKSDSKDADIIKRTASYY